MVPIKLEQLPEILSCVCTVVFVLCVTTDWWLLPLNSEWIPTVFFPQETTFSTRSRPKNGKPEPPTTISYASRSLNLSAVRITSCGPAWDVDYHSRGSRSRSGFWVSSCHPGRPNVRASENISISLRPCRVWYLNGIWHALRDSD